MPYEVTSKLQKLLELQSEIAHMHPSLERPYPVALASGGELTVYDVDPGEQCYRPAARLNFPIPLPDKVRAAFPLEDYDNRMVCVVTEDIFAEPGGYITIFHEFVHCYQFYTEEPQLKQTLPIARRAQQQGDFMWEINYPFPYSDKQFEERYSDFLHALVAEAAAAAAVETRRQAVQDVLSADDLDYLVWQEWKEGFARYIENKLQAHFGLPLNTRGTEAPFSRVTFYAGGAAYIQHIARREPEVITDLKALFVRLKGSQRVEG